MLQSSLKFGSSHGSRGIVNHESAIAQTAEVKMLKKQLVEQEIKIKKMEDLGNSLRKNYLKEIINLRES